MCENEEILRTKFYKFIKKSGLQDNHTRNVVRELIKNEVNQLNKEIDEIKSQKINLENDIRNKIKEHCENGQYYSADTKAMLDKTNIAEAKEKIESNEKKILDIEQELETKKTDFEDLEETFEYKKTIEWNQMSEEKAFQNKILDNIIEGHFNKTQETFLELKNIKEELEKNLKKLMDKNNQAHKKRSVIENLKKFYEFNLCQNLTEKNIIMHENSLRKLESCNSFEKQCESQNVHKEAADNINIESNLDKKYFRVTNFLKQFKELQKINAGTLLGNIN